MPRLWHIEELKESLLKSVTKKRVLSYNYFNN